MNHLDHARDVLDAEIEGLQKVRNTLGPAFSDAVDLILRTLAKRGKIVVTGMGKNLHIAEKISATLASTGSTSVALSPTQAMHGDLGVLCKGDVVLALSYSGETEELVSFLPLARRLGVRVVALTGSPRSTLARHSDVVVLVKISREACPFNMAPTASTTATLAVGDAIAIALLRARGFRKEDYAKLHPGGSIGRALLLRVSDIMRTGARVAKVRVDATVRHALVAMTRTRSGSAAVVDRANRVVGIFTDGDLRRHISRIANLLRTPIARVMTASPITVRADALALEVVKVFEDHNIDDVIVVDDEGRLAGSVDVQDLPKLKLL